MVEHAAVNRRVVGSSPTSGAISFLVLFFSLIHKNVYVWPDEANFC